jgi:hypothetical protein
MKTVGEPMSYRTLAGAAAVAALALSIAPAQADEVTSTSCAGVATGNTCATVFRHGTEDPNIRYVPAPHSEAEVAEMRQREQGWLALCRPQVLQDRYGVEHYVYAAPGCEFGRYR